MRSPKKRWEKDPESSVVRHRKLKGRGTCPVKMQS
jgi:hypothetical protein